MGSEAKSYWNQINEEVVKQLEIENQGGGGGATRTGGRDTLGRRLLSLIYPKRSAVVIIRKWTEEGKTVQKYELNRVVRELRKAKRYKHALEICEWMTIQPDFRLLPGDYAVHLDLVAKIRGLASAEKFFEDLPQEMRGKETCTSLLHTYGQNKLVAKAEALMNKMSECGFLTYPLPYNHMLSLYISTGQLDKVPPMVRELKKNTSPDIVTFNLCLSVCASQNNLEGAEKYFNKLKKYKIDADWVTYSTLTNLYIKNSQFDEARSTLKQMEKLASRKARVAYSSIITLHANMDGKDGVYRVWKKIKSLFLKMNDAEYTSMIASLLKVGEFDEAENIYTEWESVSNTGDTRISNLLLAAYINKHQIEKAERFLERMIERGVTPSYTTWELLTWGFLKIKKMDKVLDYFQKAIKSVEIWKPDDRIVGEILENLEKLGDVNGAENLLVILRNSGHVTTTIYNSLLRTYKKAGKMPLIVAERMRKDKIPLNKETEELIKSTSKLCVADASSVLS
ncbi:hypothetical protein AQUCO_05400115v1 [Aquilegia coerulea]|uniref:PROP1-like PPR domain-containing protein n=1 Tax=Aquilegia coerulea TaxID=218851 RepID=A0A2G5CIZ2_AQUCA|nr:hypothetical protein AQUCO_05400115v1 [Aquilegia coerulea]